MLETAKPGSSIPVETCFLVNRDIYMANLDCLSGEFFIAFPKLFLEFLMVQAVLFQIF